MNAPVKAPICRIITPVGMLGYGLEERELLQAIDQNPAVGETPTAIICDSGSTDSGPGKLALGTTTCPHSAYVRDLRKLVAAVCTHKVPLLISSAGGDGSNAHVDELTDIVKEVSEPQLEKAKSLKVISIYSEIPKDLVQSRLKNGAIRSCGPCPPRLAPENIVESPIIVAQMGPEPFLQAMLAEPDFDVIIGGRAYDPAPYVAYAAFCAIRGSKIPQPPQRLAEWDSIELGCFTHMGKLMECGGVCATPKSAGAMALIYPDGVFEIKPTNPNARCTPVSVAAHALYENTRPDILYGPGGACDLTGAVYEQMTDGVSVRVYGSKFTRESPKYTIKLEAARVAGHRAVFMGFIRDPIMIPQIDSFLGRIKAYVARQHPETGGNHKLEFHIYGENNNRTIPTPAKTNGCSPGRENDVQVPEEIFIVGEALAADQSVATSIASTARIGCTHGPYKNQKATAGNLGMGIGGRLEWEMGPCTEFSIYHLMELEDGEEAGHDQSSAISDTARGAGSLFSWRTVKLGDPNHSKADDPPRAVPRRPSLDTHLLPGGEKNTRSSSLAGPPTPGLWELFPALSPTSTLTSIARVIRSKNSGPYEVTLDVMFDDPLIYQVVKANSLLGADLITRIYDLPSAEDIVWLGFCDPALAFKVTVTRRRMGVRKAAGGFGEDDVHATQEHRPLMGVMLGEELVEELRKANAEE
ncbi:MAG: hypothetical protein M4579_005301 [Chaenotheca gracillima]|nr:MAG: hypothetical protein M4579_005301 [Chaenotheca gracillima]